MSAPMRPHTGTGVGLALAAWMAWSLAAFADPAGAGVAPPSPLALAVMDSAQVEDHVLLPDAEPVAAVVDSGVTLNDRPQISGRRVRLTRSGHNVMRAGPAGDDAIVGVFRRGANFPVIAKSGEWYNVRISASETGWVHAALCEEIDDTHLQFQANPRLFSRTGSYVLSAYTGAYAFDRKSNSFVVGGRLGYYVFDRLQIEGGAGWTHVRRPAEIVESLFDLTLEAEDFHMLFYHLVATWEILPGRQMVPYVSVGAGSSILRGDSEPSWDLGAGTSLYLSRRLAMRWEVRTYQFHSGAEGARRANHNVEFTLGTSVLF